MGEGRDPRTRTQREGSPARKAGLFVYGAVGTRLRHALALPRLEGLTAAGYRHERLRDLTTPIAGGLVEAGVVGVIADKVYGVHPALLALITAAPMFGNLSSFLWARVTEGRRKVPMLTAMQLAMSALVALVAFLPAGPAGGWLLAAIVVVSRLLLGGILTLRSVIWTLNYPGPIRGRVTARLSVYAMLSITATAALAGVALDADPQSFRFVYPAGCLLSCIGIAAFARVELLGERDHLRAERGEPATPRPEGVDAPESALPDSPAAPGRGLFALLRDDPLFARYQLWQFLLGTANMVMEGPLVLLVSRDLGASFSVSIALAVVIPLGLSIVTAPFWGSWIERVHIAEFRAKHSGLFALSQLIVWLGALQGSLWWIGAGRFVLGIARGGGVIAWQIGHNHFSTPERAARYMGVHVTLTGVRGAFAPFLGVLLYVGWAGIPIPGTGLALPALEGIGAHVMAISTALSLCGTFGYIALHRRVRASGLADTSRAGSG